VVGAGHPGGDELSVGGGLTVSAEGGAVSVGIARSVQIVQQPRAVSGQAVRLDPPAEQVAGREELLASCVGAWPTPPGWAQWR